MVMNQLRNVSDNKDKINNNITQKFTAKADSGCTSHFFPLVPKICNSIRKSDNNLNVVLPNNEIITSNVQGLIPIEGVSEKAKTTRLFPNIRAALISLGQLCDDDCTVTLRKNDMQVFRKDKLILEGSRNHNNGMWEIQLDNKQQ